jgi:GTP 3',8-cyclase
MDHATTLTNNLLTDGFARQISYLRLSVTDRCDMRCRYCMAETMQFLPKASILSLEELAAIADAFIARGVRKIRLTGGEPLVRRDIDQLARRIGRHLAKGALDELTLTTNGNHLAQFAPALFDAGIRRINVSLDSLDPERYRHITRWGDLPRVLDGIAAAKTVGLKIKLNMVALNGLSAAELDRMLAWCGAEGHDLTLIEAMPLGAIDEQRGEQYLPLDHVFAQLAKRYTLLPLDHQTGGPARYWQVVEAGVKLGLITPLSHNFCSSCNRVRVTIEGKLYLCLGQDAHVDLRAALRNGGMAGLDAALTQAMALKPERHDFNRALAMAVPAVARHMSVTGG